MLMCRGNLSALHANNRAPISFIYEAQLGDVKNSKVNQVRHFGNLPKLALFFFFMKIQISWGEFCLILISTDCSFIGSCEGVRTQLFLK